jgi:hypothetical protein
VTHLLPLAALSYQLVAQPAFPSSKSGQTRHAAGRDPI